LLLDAFSGGLLDDLVTKSFLKEVAFIGDELIRPPIRGVVVSFHGLGHPLLRTELIEEEKIWADNGLLTVFPYYGPWSWMNRQARAFVDEFLDAVYVNYGLSDDIPFITHGGSMGGFSALLYARYAKRKVARCVAICAVCDMEASFHERPDVPRTIHCAFQGYQENMETLYREHSPLLQVESMPRIPYLLIHTSGDASVSKTLHSDKMAAALRKHGHDVTYYEIKGGGHCTPLPEEVQAAKTTFILDTRVRKSEQCAA